MEFVIASYLGFLLLLFFAAYEDLKQRRVSNLLAAGLWFVLFMTSWVNPSIAVDCVGMFALIFIINEISCFIGRPIFGWGDVFVIPVCIAFGISFVGIMTAIFVMMWVLVVFLFARMIAWFRSHKRFDMSKFRDAKFEYPLVLMAFIFNLIIFGIWVVAAYLSRGVP